MDSKPAPFRGGNLALFPPSISTRAVDGLDRRPPGLLSRLGLSSGLRLRDARKARGTTAREPARAHLIGLPSREVRPNAAVLAITAALGVTATGDLRDHHGELDAGPREPPREGELRVPPRAPKGGRSDREPGSGAVPVRPAFTLAPRALLPFAPRSRPDELYAHLGMRAFVSAMQQVRADGLVARAWISEPGLSMRSR